MAARVQSKAYTLTVAPVSFKDAVTNGGTNPIYVASIVMRAKWDNAGRVFWTDLAGNIGGYLEPREAATLDFAPGSWISLDELTLYGIDGDTVYITVMS